MTTLIQIEHVGKFYYMGGETIRALEGIPLDIEHGEFGAIMGPSGSGKSTLMIGSLDVADKGAYENVELPLIYRGMSKKEREPLVLDALESVDLLDRKKRFPSELSGGQQRVAIAQTLAGEPAIILADVPTGALDSKTGVETLNILKRLKAQGRTIILITYDISIAQQAKRIVWFRDGRLNEVV